MIGSCSFKYFAPVAFSIPFTACQHHSITQALIDTQSIDQVWQNPSDLEARNLYWGPGGKENYPDISKKFEFDGLDTSGHSRGFDLIDEKGHKWDVKIGAEAQTEVVLSRVLWALGYYQPITYFIKDWTMKNSPNLSPKPGRFRLKDDHKSKGRWSWFKIPLSHSREIHGLVVANVLMGNWDLKPSNNRIYRLKSDDSIVFVVQDLGASLGSSKWPVGSRNVLEDFLQDKLIARRNGQTVDLTDRTWRQHPIRNIPVADVVWICRLLVRISQTQWLQAFKAGGYDYDTSMAYIGKIGEKIREGLNLH